MTIKLGDRGIWLPRTPYGRQYELLCFVTRVVDGEAGVVDLVAFPSNGEVMHISGAVRRSETVHIHCWEPVADSLAELRVRIGMLEGLARVDSFTVAADQPSSDEGASVKRGPGRPRKVDAA